MSDDKTKDDAGPGVLGYFVRHRTASNLLLVIMLLAGFYAAANLRSQFFPDIVREAVSVNVVWDGAGAADIDEGAIAVLEPPLLAVEGVDEALSVAREGSGTITLTFEDGWNMARASDDVQAVVDAITTLPDDIDDPTVRRSAYSERVIDVPISGTVGVERLAGYADELVARLFQAGVPRTDILGVPEPVIRITAPEEDLLRHDLTLTELGAAVTADVTGRPAGDVDAQTARVRAGEDRRTAEEVGDIVIRSQPDGSKLRLRDVATVAEDGTSDSEAYFRSGIPTVVVRVRRDATGDTIAIEDTVKRVVAELSPTLPDNVEMRIARSRAEPIRDRRDMLIRNGLSGLALVLILLFLFLSARTAFWVAMGIPVSIAATLGIMYATGQTLNMISMFGLIISLGIIVDDAIVVGEHADALKRKGLSAARAAGQAARRMAGPVFSASVTTVIAFSALAMIGGRFGSLIAAIPLVVSAVIIASLIESFLILPAHMRHALSAKNSKPWYDAPSRAFNRAFVWFRERLFRPFMYWVIRLRYLTLSAAIAALIATFSLFADGSVRWVFFSAPERGTINANVVMADGATRSDTREMLDEMQRALDALNLRYLEEHGREAVEYSLATLGGTSGWRFSAGDNKPADLLGGFEVSLIDADLRPYTAFDFLRDWEDEVVKTALTETLAMKGARAGPGGDAIDVKFAGAGAETLKAAAETLKTELSRLNGVTGLDDTLVYDKVELIMTLTPRGEAMGFTTASLGQELRARLNGIEAAEFARDARQVSVMVEPPEAEIGADYLSSARIRTPAGGVVTLGEIADIRARQGFASIRREDGLRVATVTGDVADEERSTVATALSERILPDIAAQYAIAYEQGGLAEQEREFLSDALVGFGLCLAGIFLALAWVLSSWTRPILVMLIIPFGLIGALWGHFFFDMPLSMFSVVGLIGMAGIIINDSIVLVTTIDEHAETRGTLPSIVDGATDRLRAVLLTTLTTVGGLTPLLFEGSVQAQFLKPTVVTLAFGLGFGVVLVLLVTPAVLAVEHDVRMALSSLRRAWRIPARRRQRERARPTGRWQPLERLDPSITGGESLATPSPAAARNAAE